MNAFFKYSTADLKVFQITLENRINLWMKLSPSYDDHEDSELYNALNNEISERLRQLKIEYKTTH